MSYSGPKYYRRLQEKVVTARKPHHCDECYVWIEPNTRYRRTAIKVHSTVITHKSHLNHEPVIMTRISED